MAYVQEWGAGDRVAVLVHGLSGSSASWRRIGPELADRGYRVLAPDLAGHGRGPRGRYSRERWADDLLEALPAAPELAIGHSLGAVLLAMIVERLRPARAVYEDPAWYPWQGPGYGDSQPAIRAMKTWTEADIRAASPRWTDEDVAARRESLRDWDPDTTRMAYLETAYVPVLPLVPSMILLADPSMMVPPPLAEHFAERGFTVRTVPGTGHNVHTDNHEGYLAALEGWV